MADIAIRRAEAADVPALLDIYNHYVAHTHVTFDIAPRTLEQRLSWFATFADEGFCRCFVAARGTVPIGWACSGPFKEKAAYATSVETSVYLAPDETGQGLGRRLYATLFEALSQIDVHRAYGGIAQPNAASVALHERIGFVRVGTYREVGRKFGRFWDVAVYEKAFPARP
ncbi:MAG TPA: GNAT family N-acetyltransferase [Rhizomicrobium sp.]|jgi:phosphinothricin acetyltransferase